MVQLTALYVDALLDKIAAGERVKSWHGDGDGFGIRVRSSGRADYYLIKGNKKLAIGKVGRSKALGADELRLAEARTIAREKVVDLTRGVDIFGAKAAARAAERAAKSAPPPINDTFSTVLASFIDRYARPKLRTWRQIQGALEKDAAPLWGKTPIGEISRAHVRQLIHSIEGRGSPRQAAIVRAYLSKFFNWAVGMGYVEFSPVTGLPTPHTNPSRERVLADNELRMIWIAADRLGWPFGPIVQLLALTGQRKMEIAGGEWREIDLAQRLWSLSRARTKNKTEHAFALSPPALEIIEKLPRFAGVDLIFSTTGETVVSGFSRAKRNIDAIVKELNDRKDIADWTYHDLRRTAATNLAKLKIQPIVIESILNHKSGEKRGVAGIYNRHDYEDDARKALEAWGRRLTEIVTGESVNNIVDLRKGKAVHK